MSAALVHYQFETIHPFLDGNGRIGRMLIPLYLMERGALTRPALYASLFLKRNQAEYYDRLALVRKTGDYEQWVRFFLEAIDEAATSGFKSTRKLVALHAESEGSARSGRQLFFRNRGSLRRGLGLLLDSLVSADSDLHP